MINDVKQDLELATKMQSNSHEPYNNFYVGAVLTAKSGKKYTGCNIANHGIQSICAERVAFVKAISEGEKEFESIAVVGSNVRNKAEACLPCGYCRQFMSEFVDSNFKVFTVEDKNEKEYKEYTMKELLPFGFEL